MTLDDLIAYGANVDEGLTRCMGNEGMYLMLVGTVKGEAGFGKLREAVEAGDLDTAFETAHALKGILGNLALTPLFEPMQEITELLRSRTEMDYTPLLDQIAQAKAALDALE